MDRVTAALADIPAEIDDSGRLEALGRAGEERRSAVYEDRLGEETVVSFGSIRTFVDAARSPVGSVSLSVSDAVTSSRPRPAASSTWTWTARRQSRR